MNKIKAIPIFDLIKEPNNPGGYLAIDLSYGYKVNQELLKFLQYDVLPDYLRIIDRAHSLEHILDVCKNSLILAEDMGLNYDIILTAAVYHDIGLTADYRNLILADKNEHYYTSHEALKADEHVLLEVGLTKKQIQLIEIAILEMGLDRKSSPYSTLLSDADKLAELNPDYLIKKSSNHMVAMYTYKPVDQLINGIYSYIHKRYSKDSYYRKYYTPIGKHIYSRKIRNIDYIVNDKDAFIRVFTKIIDEENKKNKARG